MDNHVEIMAGGIANLIISSDAEEAEKITDISALASLKEVTGNIVIRNSYNGADLTEIGRASCRERV